MNLLIQGCYSVLLLLALAASTFAQPATPRSIRVVMDNNYPPFAFTDGEGKLQGILVDEWHLWEKATGIKVELHGMDWGKALQRMTAGEFDVIDTIFETPERTTFLDFAEPYSHLEVPIFFRKEISGITDLNSLRGFPVAVKAGDAAVDLLQERGVTTLLPFPSYEAIIEAAKQGRVNVFVVDKPPALYFLHKLGLEDDFRQSAPINVGHFHRAVKKGNLDLLKVVERGFASLDEAQLKRLEEKWYGKVIGWPPRLRYLGYALVAALFLILSLMAWNLFLKRLISRRTAALQHSESRLRALLDHIPDWVWLKDLNSKYITANVPYAQAVNCSLEKLPGRSDADLWPQADASQFVASDQLVVESGRPSRIARRLPDAQGGVRWVETFKAPVRSPEGRTIGIVGIARDITERTQAETELRHTNRTLRMISECDKVLVRATDEGELLNAICHLVVEVGGYRMAWVGFAEWDEAKSVRPVAQAGFEDGYLHIADINWADTERGRGPVGTAIRTEQAVVSRNVLTDPAFGPWREAAIERGYAALAALPLKRDQRVMGALTVYAREPDTFDPAEVSLLTQLADDLVYGITALRTRLEQKRVEDELHLLSARLLQVRDQERRHLARELHDTTAQHLAVLSLDLTNLKALLTQSSERAALLCADCIKLVHQAAQEIRTHSYLLHPPLLEAMGLTGAVEDYAQGFAARSGIALEVSILKDFGRLPDHMELALFRIVQEGLTNILKHSRSVRAEIRFMRGPSSVKLEIRDMGRGIPAEVLARIKARRGGSGVGLGGMQERLRLLGGELDIETGAAGTVLRATVPLRYSPPEP